MRAGASKPRLRVMTMTDGLVGGAEDVARQISQRLDPDRFDSTLVVTRWDDEAEAQAAPILAELGDAGTDFIGMRRESRFDLRAWRRLLGEMRERRIDVLHTHKIGSNIWGALLTPRVPVPVFVAHEHTWSWQGQPHRRLIDRHLIARRAQAFVAVSRADRRNMTEIEGIPAAKTRFIPIGLPEPRRSRSPEEVRAELGVEPGRPIVGLVGTLRPQKAYEVMLEAAVILRREFPQARILIAGGEENDSTAEKPRLEGLARELGVAGTVTFLGYRPDSFDFIRSVDMGAQASDYEGSPQSVLEFLEAAKPVVVTAVGGVPDMVRDGETGYLVPPRDPEALADGLARLLRDPGRAAAMGAAGQDLRRTEFTMDGMISQTEALYEELYERVAAERGRG
jgi:glycosyltransferase involved in cell wall biosynthesis